VIVLFKRAEGSPWEPLRCHLSGRTNFSGYEACYRARHLMRFEGFWEVRVLDGPVEWCRFYRNENGAAQQDGGVEL
jgi:hypothetical protein